jgi:hypothetical protein
MNIDIFCNLCNEKNIIDETIDKNKEINIIENEEINTIKNEEINIFKNNKNNELKNKNVSFHTTVKVILIPDRNEEKYNKFISRFEDSVQIEK